ncbi:MAG: NAD(P)H-dependent oxidoreductase, partial [Stellaceae bacterium]
RTFRSTPEGKIGMLRDRPVIVVSAHGGFCADAPPGQPDFLTPYLRAIFQTIGISQIDFIRLEGLSRGPDRAAAALANARAWINRRLPEPQGFEGFDAAS